MRWAGTTTLLLRLKSWSPTSPLLTLEGCHYCSLSSLLIIKHHCRAEVQVLALYLVSFDTTVWVALLLLGCGRSPDSPWGILWHYPSGGVGSPHYSFKRVAIQAPHLGFAGMGGSWCTNFLCGVWLEHSIYYFKFYYFARLRLSLRDHACFLGTFFTCALLSAPRLLASPTLKSGIYETKKK